MSCREFKAVANREGLKQPVRSALMVTVIKGLIKWLRSDFIDNFFIFINSCPSYILLFVVIIRKVRKIMYTISI